jgi:hypothetical protein
MRNLVLAYIDPGAGSIALQLILAGVAGLAVVGRALVRRVREWVFRRRTPPPAPGQKG